MKVRRNNLRLILVGALVAIGLVASGYDVLYILDKTGHSNAFILNDSTRLQFAEGDMIYSDEYLTMHFPLSDVKGWKVEAAKDTTTNVQPTIERRMPKVVLRGHTINISELPLNSTCCLYNMDGALLRRVDADTECDIDCSGLSRGVYILNINGFTVKLLNK